MPIMTRMREGMPVILFGLLILFLVMIVFEWGMDYLGIRGGHGDIVGKIDGKKITYRDFSDMLKTYTDNAKAQTGKEVSEEEMPHFRDEAWSSLVTQALLEEQVEKLGLQVTDQELVDWVRGPNPPEDLRRNFIDSTGEFRREYYEQFLNNPNQFIRDPSGQDQAYGTHWLANYEKNLRQRRLSEKLQSLIFSTVRISDGEMRDRFALQNQRIEAQYMLFDIGLVNDNDVQLTDADIKAYYEENIDQYKVEAVRKLKYVLFHEAPSASDSSMRKKDIEEATQLAKNGTDFIQLTAMYSEKADSGSYVHLGDLTPAVGSALVTARPGDVIGPISEQDGYRLVKVLDARNSASDYVHASHILIPAEEDTNASKTHALEILREARAGKDFATLATQYSKDPGSAANGGDLGWFGKGRMVPAFEQACLKAKIGEIVGPVRTQFGWHIIKVTGRDNREFKISSIFTKITASSQTKTELYERAKDFGVIARKEEFVKEAQQSGFDVRETQVQEKGSVVPGLGVNDALIHWAFNSKVNEVSEPFTVNNGYVVVTVSEAKSAGVRPLDELKESLRPLVLRKKKIDKTMEMAAAVRAKLDPKDSLSRAIPFAPAGVKLEQTGQITAGGMIPSLGRDLGFIGSVQTLEPGKISNPVAGNRGALLIQVLSRQPFDSTAYAAQRAMMESRLLAEKKQRFLNEWLAKLKEKADIEDHRDLFFR